MDINKSPVLREVRTLGMLLRACIATACVGFVGGIVALLLNWLFVSVPGWFGTPGQLNLIEQLMPGIFSSIAEVCLYTALALAVSLGIYWLVAFIESRPLAPATEDEETS